MPKVQHTPDIFLAPDQAELAGPVLSLLSPEFLSLLSAQQGTVCKS